MMQTDWLQLPLKDLEPHATLDEAVAAHVAQGYAVVDVRRGGRAVVLQADKRTVFVWYDPDENMLRKLAGKLRYCRWCGKIVLDRKTPCSECAWTPGMMPIAVDTNNTATFVMEPRKKLVA
jgi:hypothetical protein